MFAANLLRLQSQVTLARARMAAPSIPGATAPAPTTVAAVTPTPRSSEDRLAHGLVDRVSRTEVQVRSRPSLGNAPTAVVAYRDAPEPTDASAPAVPAPSYPIRIRLPE
jgi:hypothetical protein